MIIATDFPARESPAGCAAAEVVSNSNEEIATLGSRPCLDPMRFLARGLPGLCSTFAAHSMNDRPASLGRAAMSRSAGRRERSEVECGAKRDHPSILPEASIAVEDAGAWAKDILDLRLQHPPRRYLRLVDHLDHDLSAPHRIEEVPEGSDVRVQPACIVADARVAGGNADLVVRATSVEAFVQQACVSIKIDQVAIVGYAAGADEPREAPVVGAGNAIEHLIHDTIDAGVAGVIERNAGRHRVGERAAGIVEALIAETRV